MATTTKNYGLTKPSNDDPYDVEVFNANAEIIDSALKDGKFVGTYPDAVTFGTRVFDVGERSICAGDGNEASGDYSVSMGQDNISSSTTCVTMGIANASGGYASVALGNNNVSSGESSFAAGKQNCANADNSVAIGENNNRQFVEETGLWLPITAGESSVSLGSRNQSTGQNTVSIGDFNTTTKTNGVSLGYSNANQSQFGFAAGNGNKLGETASNTVAIGQNNEVQSDSASFGSQSVALGNNNITRGIGMFCIGSQNEPHRSSTSGYTTSNYTFLVGYNNSMLPLGSVGSYGMALGHHLQTSDNMIALGLYNDTSTMGFSNTNGSSTSSEETVFVIGNGYHGMGRNTFRIARNDSIYTNSAINTSGADFAEYYEWEDGNSKQEDRAGLFVALNGEKIVKANAGDDILGIVSAAPSFIADAQAEEWQGMYLKDVFGRKLTQKTENGEEYVLNPDYDETKPYVMRELRPEWDVVATLGKVVMVDDGTAKVNGYVTTTDNGIATKSKSKTKYRVMKRLDDKHIRVVIL